jgi:uncharacterized protein with ParB-like and HNH nuclease domain
MEAHVKTVREILHTGDQFLVPFFQRQYSWTKKEWNNLREDIIALIEGGEETKHFLGPLVCTPFPQASAADGPRYQLIDGQQRLTTLTLALAALRDIARLRNHEDLADEIHEDYLVHRRRQGLDRFKVVPRLEDRLNYELAIDGSAPGVVTSTGIIGCHSYFKRAWRNPVSDAGEPMARRILSALTARLSLVAITVDGENPYEIFESLNWKGLPLEEADLIRNFLFMQVPPGEQAAFHETYWKSFESRFEAVDRYEKVPPTQFYRNYLMRNGRYCPNKAAFVEFKRQSGERGLGTVDQIKELQQFATYELWLQRPDLCDRTYLRERLSEIQQLVISTAHPLLLNLFARHEKGYLSREELDECLRDLASFVIRRAICGESTRAYGRWFTEAITTIVTRPRLDLQNFWLEKGWPDDASFIARLVEFPIYTREPKKARLFLDSLERATNHREAVDLSKLDIEHILPQTIEDDEAGRSWKTSLGIPSWRQDHETWVHTVGNLTLTGHNSALGNNPFTAKQAMFANSNVILNRYFSTVTGWNAREIKKRAEELGRAIVRNWPRPEGRPYVPKPSEPEDSLFEPLEPVEAPRERQPHTHGNLRVEINWPALGLPGEIEIICEPKDNLTHAAFAGRLIERFGAEMSDKLQRIAVARSYPLSANPQQDFFNARAGKPYSYKPVPETRLFLFATTSNKEKKDDILSLCRRLGFPRNAVSVS